MSQERLYFLMRRYANGQIDEQEFSELRQLMTGGGDTEAIIRQVFDEVYESPGPLQDLSPERVRRMLTAIYSSEAPVVEMSSSPASASVLSPVSSPGTGVFGVRRRAIGWAAAVLLLLAGGYMIFRNRSASPATVVYRDIAAGSNKAILTLASGQQISLGDSARGPLTVEGNMQVIQLDSGQLAYVNAGKAAENAAGYNTLATPRGGQYKVTLPDGTRVWLNSASRLRYPTAFTGAMRKVELSGEAYFEVAKNSRQPFTVAAAGMAVNVLGTDFNLNAYNDEDSIRTTLVDGAVRLVYSGDALEIRPGEQGSLALDGKQGSRTRDGKRMVVSHPDVQEVLAWKNGEFIFYSQPIQVIMRQVSRWYDVDIEYRGAPPTTLFTGDIARASKASALLDMLETVGDVHFEIGEHKIIVLAGHKAV